MKFNFIKKIFPLCMFSLMVQSHLFSAIILSKDQSFHKDYNLEWIYLVGHYTLENEQEVGMELSFFRAKFLNKKTSTQLEVFPVHLAISDFSNKRHYTSQILGRSIGGLAKYQVDKIQVEHFSIEITPDGKYHIKAYPNDNSKIAIDMYLEPNEGNFLLHGKNGISLKSNLDPSFVSNYYSITRIPTSGSITIQGITRSIQPSNSTWLDHEWSMAGLGDQNNSWDWVGISLDDGSDWMAFRFRKEKSNVSEVFASRFYKNQIQTFDPSDDLKFEPNFNKIWTSPASKVVYPMEWRLSSKSHALDLIIQPIFDEQEFDARRSTGLAYWEGGVKMKGFHNGVAVSGKGYLELKGYK